MACIDNIPPEILAIVFGLVLGREPFGEDERSAYNCLQSVCPTWKHVVSTTPKLCTGLAIDLDRWQGRGLQTFKDEFAPWLAIVGRDFPYHLKLTSDGGPYASDYDHDREAIAHFLLTTEPRPTHLWVGSFHVFWDLLDFDFILEQVEHLVIQSEDPLDDFEISHLGDIFPQLDSFVVKAHFTFVETFAHASLQSLTLSDAMGPADELAQFVIGLPCLRELRITSEDIYEPSKNPDKSGLQLVHSTLEILVVGGEDLLQLLIHLTLPSLKFFALETWGMTSGGEVLENVVPPLFHRSRLANTTVSLNGHSFVPLFTILANSLPPTTLFHFNLGLLSEFDEGEEKSYTTHHFAPLNAREIICSTIEWLGNDMELTRRDVPVKTYFSEDVWRDEGGEKYRNRWKTLVI